MFTWRLIIKINYIIKYYIVDFDLKINDLLDIDLKMDE